MLDIKRCSMSGAECVYYQPKVDKEIGLSDSENELVVLFDGLSEEHKQRVLEYMSTLVRSAEVT